MEIKIFEHNEFGQVRIIDQGGEPWFVAKDVADILGYANPSQMYARLDEDERAKIASPDLGGANSMAREFTLINESGLYNAILGSQKPDAKRFKKWVTSEILPDIRRHGFYGTDMFIEKLTEDPLALKAMLDKYIFEREQRRLVERQRDQAIIERSLISRTREATAMNTASQFKKKNEKLQIEIGESTNWKQTIAVSWLKDYFQRRHINKNGPCLQQIGRRLSALSRQMGYEIKYAEHSKHGKVGVYHVNVILRFKAKLDADPEMLAKYRR